MADSTKIIAHRSHHRVQSDSPPGARWSDMIIASNNTTAAASIIITAEATSTRRTQRLVIPYSAILYDLNGGTWAYISPEPLTFVREAITVDYIEGDMVVLVDGPSSGTEVVTVGAAELHGADTGVGK